MIPGVAAFVPHALPLATELLPPNRAAQGIMFCKKNYQMCERFSGAMVVPPIRHIAGIVSGNGQIIVYPTETGKSRGKNDAPRGRADQGCDSRKKDPFAPDFVACARNTSTVFLCQSPRLTRKSLLYGARQFCERVFSFRRNRRTREYSVYSRVLL